MALSLYGFRNKSVCFALLPILPILTLSIPVTYSVTGKIKFAENLFFYLYYLSSDVESAASEKSSSRYHKLYLHAGSSIVLSG
jgi:hypothetical protein